MLCTFKHFYSQIIIWTLSNFIDHIRIEYLWDKAWMSWSVTSNYFKKWNNGAEDNVNRWVLGIDKVGCKFGTWITIKCDPTLASCKLIEINTNSFLWHFLLTLSLRMAAHLIITSFNITFYSTIICSIIWAKKKIFVFFMLLPGFLTLSKNLGRLILI